MRRFHDLTHALNEGIRTYPAAYHPRFEMTQIGTLMEHGRESRRITLGSHTGTHIDAPSHFIKGGHTIDEIPLDRLIGPALIVRVAVGACSAVTPDHLLAALRGGHERVLLRFDWSERWGTDVFYTEQPYLTMDACRALYEAGVRLIGTDTASLDDPRQSGPTCSPDSPNHRYLLARDVVLIEYLAGLAAVGSEVIDLVALPLQLQGSDGSPARVVAIE